MTYTIIFTAFVIFFPPEPYVCTYGLKQKCYSVSELRDGDYLSLEKIRELEK